MSNNILGPIWIQAIGVLSIMLLTHATLWGYSRYKYQIYRKYNKSIHQNALNRAWSENNFAALKNKKSGFAIFFVLLFITVVIGFGIAATCNAFKHGIFSSRSDIVLSTNDGIGMVLTGIGLITSLLLSSVEFIVIIKPLIAILL